MAGTTFVEATHAAELALAAMAIRALVAREVADTPEVVSIRFTATHHPGLTVVECEVVDKSGLAIAGFSL